MHSTVTCVAILAVRNEGLHIRRAIRSFVEQGVDVIVIDNESTDDTLEICKEYSGEGLLTIERLAWRGVFDLSGQLQAKARIISELSHDWVIHADADEWLQSPVKGESLPEGITKVDKRGYNAINFDEFVFLPLPEESRDLQDSEKGFLNYYYFSPHKRRLMRAWKRESDFSNTASGGHKLMGAEMKLAPESFILRHYIAISQQHIEKKYLNRTFSDMDLNRGWHGNRQNLNAELLKFPETHDLKKLSHWDDVDFDRSDPKQKHYWEW